MGNTPRCSFSLAVTAAAVLLGPSAGRSQEVADPGGGGVPPASAAVPEPEAIAALREGYTEYLRTVSYAGAFRVAEFDCETEEAARTTAAPPPDDVPATSGEVVKESSRLRVRYTPLPPPFGERDGTPIEAPSGGDASAADGIVVWLYEPSVEAGDEPAPAYARVDSYVDDHPHESFGTVNLPLLPSVLTGMTGGNPLALRTVLPLTSETVRRVSDGLVVEQKFDVQGELSTATSWWDVGGPLPVLTRFRMETDSPPSRTTTVEEVIADDWVELSGGKVPRRVRKFWNQTGMNSWLTTEWSAEELTDSISDGDFAVPIPDGLPVLGLKSPPVGNGRVLNPLDIDPSELTVPSVTRDQALIVRRNLAAGRGIWGRALIWLSAAAFVVAAWVLWRRRGAAA